MSSRNSPRLRIRASKWSVGVEQFADRCNFVVVTWVLFSNDSAGQSLQVLVCLGASGPVHFVDSCGSFRSTWELLHQSLDSRVVGCFENQAATVLLSNPEQCIDACLFRRICLGKLEESLRASLGRRVGGEFSDELR